MKLGYTHKIVFGSILLLLTVAFRQVNAQSTSEISCIDELNEADENGDGRVNSEEYVTFVQLLAEADPPVNPLISDATTFQELPRSLQDNFIFLACLCITQSATLADDTSEGISGDCCLGENAHIPIDATSAISIGSCVYTEQAIDDLPNQPFMPPTAAPIIEPSTTPAPVPVDVPTDAPATPETPTAEPDVPTIAPSIPETPTAEPDVPTIAPSIPETPTAEPDVPTAAPSTPETPTAEPDAPTAAPAIPDTPTAEPDVPTAAPSTPDTPTAEPDVPTAAPAIPDTPTAEPEVPTAAPAIPDTPTAEPEVPTAEPAIPDTPTAEPVVPTIEPVAPTTAPDPECPAEIGGNQCAVCGVGQCVSSPDAILAIPGQPEVACGVLEATGCSGGIISPEQCAQLPFVIGICECVPCDSIDVPTMEPEPTAAPIGDDTIDVTVPYYIAMDTDTYLNVDPADTFTPDLIAAMNNLVPQVLSSDDVRRFLRRRLATFVSSNITGYVDADCPATDAGQTDPNAKCKIADHIVTLNLSPGEDAATTESEFSADMTTAINDGRLQEELLLVNPDSLVGVVETDGPVTLPPTPTTAPTPGSTADTGSPTPAGDDDDGGIGTGAIIGIVIAIVVILAIVIIICSRSKGQKTAAEESKDESSGLVQSRGLPESMEPVEQEPEVYVPPPAPVVEEPPKPKSKRDLYEASVWSSQRFENNPKKKDSKLMEVSF